MRVPVRSHVARGIALAAAGVAVWHVPGELRDAWSEARNASARTRLERQLGPADVVGLSETDIFLRADEAIPRSATYYVDLSSSSGELAWVRPFATYWLLPRRRTDDLAEAEWILSYRGDLEALGLDYERVITLRPGFALAEVRP
jgi:hypothetical protein